VALGGWALPAMRLLAAGRRLRGTRLDPFGRTAERRLERQLVDDYRAAIESMLPTLDVRRLPVAVSVARVPERIRGFGHVKLASIDAARARWQALQAAFDGVVVTVSRPRTGTEPATRSGAKQAGDGQPGTERDVA
jgi:indolepyruvate ferredoxin oxidoreductase